MYISAAMWELVSTDNLLLGQSRMRPMLTIPMRKSFLLASDPVPQ